MIFSKYDKFSHDFCWSIRVGHWQFFKCGHCPLPTHVNARMALRMSGTA